MNQLESRAYQDTVEIAKAAFAAGGDKYPWISEERREGACDFIQAVYDKLLSIASSEKN